MGGFDEIRYKRHLPVRGPGGLAILLGVAAVCTYGFFRVGKGNLEKRWVESERMARMRVVKPPRG